MVHSSLLVVLHLILNLFSLAEISEFAEIIIFFSSGCRKKMTIVLLGVLYGHCEA
jgi:hypothetical protein